MPAFKKRNNLLVFGYVRENTLQTHAIPIALIKLFEAYHENSSKWRIPGTDINAASSHYINGPTFVSQGIKFQFVLDTYYTDQVYVRLKIDGDSLSSNISSFDIDVEMNGNIFPKKYKKQHRLTFNHINWSNFCGNGVQIGDDSEIIENEQDIDICFYFEIMDIKYNKMNTHSVFNWILNEKEIESFKTSKEVIKSKVFNNWIMELTPFGRDDSKRGERVTLTLKPISVPYKVNMFGIKCKLSMESESAKFWNERIDFDEERESKRYYHDYGVVFAWSRSVFLIPRIDKLSISMDVEIQNIRRLENNWWQKQHMLEKNRWQQYGFIIDS